MLKRPDINHLYETLVKTGNDYADKRYASLLLDKTEKSVLAKLANESGQSSEAARERWARAHPDFEEHIRKACEADREEIKARVLYDSTKAYTELLRSSEATERQANKNAT